MKRIFYAAFGIITLWCAAGCGKFLDKTPLDKIGSDTQLAEAEAEALINGAYQPLMWPKLYNMRIWTLDIVAGES